MSDHDIYVRLTPDGMAFVYSIRLRDGLIESKHVSAPGAQPSESPETEITPGYYGGSEVMD